MMPIRSCGGHELAQRAAAASRRTSCANPLMPGDVAARTGHGRRQPHPPPGCRPERRPPVRVRVAFLGRERGAREKRRPERRGRAATAHGSQLRQPLVLAVGRRTSMTTLPALDVAQFAQALAKRLDDGPRRMASSSGGFGEKADARRAPGRLRPHERRPDQRGECRSAAGAAVHVSGCRRQWEHLLQVIAPRRAGKGRYASIRVPATAASILRPGASRDVSGPRLDEVTMETLALPGRTLYLAADEETIHSQLAGRGCRAPRPARCATTSRPTRSRRCRSSPTTTSSSAAIRTPASRPAARRRSAPTRSATAASR